MRDDGPRTAHCRRYAASLIGALESVPWGDVDAALGLLERAYRESRTVYVIGNGGSAATAAHTANDLLRIGAKAGRRGLGTVSLADKVPTLTAIANDHTYSEVFSEQLELLGRGGDVLIVFSASGNSPNVLRAIEVARRIGMATLAFLGMGGGRAAEMADVAVVVPSSEYGPVEDVHLALDHMISSYLASWIAGGERGTS